MKFGRNFENLWFAMVCIVINVGRGYVIQYHELINRKGGHRAARAAKKEGFLQ